MQREKQLTPYNCYIAELNSVSRKTHRLQEFYRFLDFHCSENQPNYILGKDLWKSFVKWNTGKFWSSEKNIKRNFSTPGEEYLRNRVLARQLLDTSTNAERLKLSEKKQTEGRRKTKKLTSLRSIQTITKKAFEGLGKEWEYYDDDDKRNIIQHFLTRCGKVGDIFLKNNDRDHAIVNVQAFLKTLANKHSAQNIQGAEIVKASLSGENLEPRKVRKLVAPTSRLEVWQKVRDRRENGWDNISDLVDCQIYSREPKFPPAVPQLIFELAIEYSSEDPSVGKIREWYNP